MVTGVLRAGTDLVWLDGLVSGLQVGGVALRADWSNTVGFPEGCFDGYARGALLAFRPSGGQLSFETCEIDDDAVERGYRLQRAVQHHSGPRRDSWDAGSVALSAIPALLAADPQALTAVTPPLSTLLPKDAWEQQNASDLTIALTHEEHRLLDQVAGSHGLSLREWVFAQLARAYEEGRC